MALTLDIAFTLALSMELLVYGVYTTLVGFALTLIWKRRKSECGGSGAWIFFCATILMFVFASFHIVLSLYRFLRAYITKPGPLVGAQYMFDLKSWDGIINNITFCVMTWLGDVLLIYRCYHVWNRNIWIVATPLLILLGAIGINVYLIFWFSDSTDLSLEKLSSNRLLNCVYPVALAKNLLTTGLIAWKIWKQHRDSQTQGVVDRGSRLSLIQVLRIVVESAMIYTLQMLVLMILNYCQSNAQLIVQSLIVPSIGIVFALISLRIHYAYFACSMDGDESRMPPTWLKEDACSVIEFTARNSLTPDVVNFTVSELAEHRASVIPEDNSEIFGSSFNSSQKRGKAQSF